MDKKRHTKVFSEAPKGDLLLWHDEMKQGPELFEWILKWGAGDQQPVVGLEVYQRFVQQRVVIFQPMGFIHA